MKSKVTLKERKFSQKKRLRFGSFEAILQLVIWNQLKVGS